MNRLRHPATIMRMIPLGHTDKRLFWTAWLRIRVAPVRYGFPN